ncbi:hypothetical protein [Vulcanisaeta distributa]|uniref:Uncharacterized protein n=1 Tax=Vulcanisaeta distributa (strain DSM 14429 / JCM 11212 / NBRC 100878 / IC-017) TaxID=572478 RepID=E1QPP0_VULDI|nr:hypothetical protein [Vulcanisaeta distributa]ADN50336.1 hypothetical protein Vdis_0946 [Vulcanisaeta distributa DSM 14429]
MRKVQKNCLTLVVDVCNDTLDRFKGVMNAAIRRVGFGGALRVLVYKCRELDFNKYIRELNSVIANNFSVSIFVYEFDDLNAIVNELNKNMLHGCDSYGVLSTIDLPASINYEKLK